MSKIEEYLSNLDKKQKIMIYLSILIIFGIIYFYFNMDYLSTKLETLQKQKEKLEVKAKKNNKILLNKVTILKKRLKKLKEEYLNISDDYKYLQNVIKTSDKLYLNDEKFYKFLKQTISYSNELNIGASYLIEDKIAKDNVNIYKLALFGEIDPQSYPNLIKYVYKIKNSSSLVGFNNFYVFRCEKDKFQCLEEIKSFNKGIKSQLDEIRKVNDSKKLFYYFKLSVEGVK